MLHKALDPAPRERGRRQAGPGLIPPPIPCRSHTASASGEGAHRPLRLRPVDPELADRGVDAALRAMPPAVCSLAFIRRNLRRLNFLLREPDPLAICSARSATVSSARCRFSAISQSPPRAKTRGEAFLSRAICGNISATVRVEGAVKMPGKGKQETKGARTIDHAIEKSMPRPLPPRLPPPKEPTTKKPNTRKK